MVKETFPYKKGLIKSLFSYYDIGEINEKKHNNPNYTVPLPSP